MNNYFILTVALLQLGGGGYSLVKGNTLFGVLYILYSLTNFVLFKMEM